MEKVNKMLYSDVMKGFLISAVVVGHSFIIVAHQMTSVPEKMTFSILCKLLSPCVFCFFYFFGYGQGLKRVRNSSKRLFKRMGSTFVSYFIWATFAWFSFQMLGSEYNIINNAKGILLNKPFTLRYLYVLFSFSGSWQYYFIFIFIVSMFFLYYFRNASIKALKIYLIVFSCLQVAFFSIVTFYLWTAEGSFENLQYLGIIIYANPLSWVIPLFWGYYRAALKKNVVAEVKTKWFYLLLAVVYCLAVMEIYVLGNKWNGYYLLDQFTLLTLLNSVLMIHLYDIVIRFVILRSKKESALLNVMGTMGRYSIIPFFVHLPYQWFVYVLMTHLIRLELNPIPAFLALSVIGLLLSYFAIKLIDMLPVKIKRLLLGV